jgi:uncharacterized protein YkwD/pSer/pThr/pTyr-binding forkhead associated (FHA) protein
MAELLVSVPDGAERTVPLAAKAVSVGRADDCDVVLSEGKASRKHCRVEPKGDGWRVVDEGSSNGTWLGGKPVLAARLKPGDEIEIGDTVITFVDESVAAAPREPRRPRPKKKSTSWSILFIPAIALAAALYAKSSIEKSQTAEASAALTRYAKAEIERAAIAKNAEAGSEGLRAARSTLDNLPNSADALALIDASILGPKSKADDEASKPRNDDWRAALDAFDADKTASPAERRSRLADLVERHFDDAVAVKPIREHLLAELTSAGDRVRLDREQTFADADAAAAEGRFGRAISLWTSWIARAQSISAEDDGAIAKRLADIIEKSRAAAQQAADQFERARKEGRGQAAQDALDAAIDRLRGTGFDTWLAARGGAAGATTTRQPGGPKTGPTAPDDPAAIALANVKRIVAAGEELARQRKFVEAASKIDEAAAAAADAGTKSEIALRAGDLRNEAAFLEKLLGWVAADTKKFSPLKLGDHLVRVSAASATDVSILDKDGNPEPHAVADLPSSAFAQFVEKAGLDKSDYVAAAVFLHDLGEEDGYQKWMRAALAVDEMRMAASQVHARCTGHAMPVEGFMPHPDDGRTIVTFEEYKRIKNAVKIAALRADLLKIVVNVEKSKQAKQVEGIRKTYAKLEEARKFALDLIFDEVKYFYPYRDRMKEYAPVQREVDDRVKAVRDVWEEKGEAKIRTDAAMQKNLEDAEKLVTEIQFFAGDPSDLVARIDAVRIYLGHDLTVQTFFQNQGELDLLVYNDKIMKKYNPSVKGPTEPEREQVRITNEYRMMFGHRRALRIHPFLVNSARGHSEDMVKGGFFDHFDKINPGKYSPEDRMKLAGYQMIGGSENIYAGGGSPESAHEGWIHSSGHHRNILTPAWVEMGSGNFGRDWTQNFGFRSEDDFEGGTPK